MYGTECKCCTTMQPAIEQNAIKHNQYCRPPREKDEKKCLSDRERKREQLRREERIKH